MLLKDTFGNGVYYSIMNQYTPLEVSRKYPELQRRLTEEEYEELISFAQLLGIRKAFIQEGETQDESFIPPFNGEGL